MKFNINETNNNPQTVTKIPLGIIDINLNFEKGLGLQSIELNKGKENKTDGSISTNPEVKLDKTIVTSKNKD